jgi:Peptidase_C39 like family
MARLIALIFTAILLPLSLGGQALAQSTAPHAGPSGQAALIPVRADTSAASSARSAATQVTVTTVYARNSSGVNQTVFSPGTGIQYTFVVRNSGGAVTASVHIEAFWGRVNYGPTQLVDQIYQNINIPSGLAGFYNPQTVPKDAVPGPYTIVITVCYAGSTNLVCAQGASTTGNPAVSGNDSLSGDGCSLTKNIASDGFLPKICGCPGKKKATCIRYWDQYAVYSKNSEDCGPASVAMALSYYLQGPHWAQTWSGKDGRTAGLTQVRNATGVPGDNPTGPADLEKAIKHYGGTAQAVISNPGIPDSALVEIAGAIRARQPVIAFIDAGALNRTAGHWLIVRGFTADSKGATSVVLYDPDQNPYNPHKVNVYAGGTITVPLAIFEKAIVSGESPAFGGQSIIVTS